MNDIHCVECGYLLYVCGKSTQSVNGVRERYHLQCTICQKQYIATVTIEPITNVTSTVVSPLPNK